MRRLRRLVLLLLLAAVMVVVASAAAIRPAAGRVLQVTIFYWGEEKGWEQGYTSFHTGEPPRLSVSTSWRIWFVTGCVATIHLTGDATGVPVSCQGKVTIGGNGRHTDFYNSLRGPTSCSTTFYAPRGTRWNLGGISLTPTADRLRFVNGPPLSVKQRSPASCAAVDDGIVLAPDLNLHDETADLFKGGWQTFTRDSKGAPTAPLSGNVTFHSTLVVGLTSLKPAKETVDPLADQIRRWVTSFQDWLAEQRRPDMYPREPPPETPTVFPAWTGGLAVTVDKQDPARLFAATQQVRAGVPTQLKLKEAPGARAVLAKLGRSPLLRIAVTVTAAGGSPLRLTSTALAPPIEPTIASVSFGGGPDNPSIAVHGAGLGALPARDPPGNLAGQGGCPGAPGTYGSGYGANLSLTDLTHNWGAGRNIPSVETDCIGVVPTKFTPAEVDFKLGSFYRANHAKFSLDPGDHVEIVVNGAHIDVRVKYGATVTS